MALRVKLIATFVLMCSPPLCAWQGDAVDRHVRAGQALLRRDSYAEAEKVFLDAIALPEITDAQRLRLAANLNSVALAYHTARRYPESEAVFRKLLDLWSKNRLTPNKYEATVLLGLASLYQGQRKFSQALPLHRRALAIWQGKDDLQTASILANMAGLLYRMGRYSEAGRSYRQALAIQENAWGIRHPEVAKTLNDLATVCAAKADYREAEELYRKALNIRELTLGPQHPEVAKTANNLAVLRMRQGRYLEAEQLYRRALAILGDVTTRDATLAVTLSNLAQLHIVGGRYSTAEQLNLDALSAWEASVGPDHPSLLSCLDSQAFILRKMKRKTEAAAFRARAAAINSKYGPNSTNHTIDVSLLRVTRK